jgi:putative spermidine/putrescine transport system permease protein
MKGPARGAFLLVLPALLVVVLLLAGGVFVTLSQALMPVAAGEIRMLTFEHFRAVVREPGFGPSLLLTFWVALVSTVFTVVLAVVTALSLRRMRGFQKVATFVYQVPLTLPHIVVAAAGIMLLSQSGLLSRVVTAIGLIESPAQFPELVFDRGGAGIIIVYVWKQIPFVGLFALSVLQTVGADYEAVARTLGARPVQALRHVLLPLLAPGLLPSAVIVFAFVFGAFEVPLLLGARYPSMISVLAYRLYTDVDLSLRPQSMALSFVIALVVFVLLAVYRLLSEARVRGNGVAP